MISRRQFGRLLAGLAAAAAVGPSRATGSSGDPPQRLRVAAIQMTPRLADVAANLEQADRLIQDAQKRGAEWIILPELFTSAAAFHPHMLSAIRSVDGEPALFMKRLARRGNCVIGGSFLAERGGRVFNSFLLVFPDGRVQRHDKDYPSLWENCVCEGGSDTGVLSSPVGHVGAALCWEFIRSETARRLLGEIQLVVGGSCWWTLPDDAPADSPLWATNLRMLKTAPARFARMLGVPVIHGSHAGRFSGFWRPELPDVAYDSSYLGEAAVVDAEGNVLARRSAREGAGAAYAEIELPSRPSPLTGIPVSFWIPQEMPESWKESWKRWLDTGSHYYDAVTRPYVDTGTVKAYVPEYLL